MIVRCLVCIPTYNNSGSIVKVIKEALSKCDLPLLIMDDGSTTPVLGLIQSDAELVPYIGSRLNVHRFPTNLGKGAAIQAAFKLALAQNFTHVITMDGDDQHKSEDLTVIFKAILERPWSMIIGKRKFDGAHIPKSSKFGRAFSNFWVKYQTDKKIEDSQSGFRAYPLYFVQDLKFYTKKYDFEIEVLIKLIWKKVDAFEVEIDVYYPPPAERVSHFDKFRDNVLISLLNTVLVILSLLKSNISRSKIIASMSLGVFIGVLPIYGFQIFVAALASLLFRLNFTLLFLAGNISLPPLIPLWTFISLKIGSKLTGTPMLLKFDQNILEHARDLFLMLFLGSILLGLVLAFITAILTYLMTAKFKSKKAWTGKSRGGKFGNYFMHQVTTHLGPKSAYFCLYFICPYFYLFAPKAVIAQNRYFKNLFPQMNFFKRQYYAVQSFFKLGQVLIDNMFNKNQKENYFSINRIGREHLLKNQNRKKGLILVGAHVGGWMFEARIFDPKKMEDINIPKMTIVEFNAGTGNNSQDKIRNSQLSFIQSSDPEAIFKINQAIDENEVIVFMGDRALNQNVELVPFFGKLAAFDSTPFKIALAKKTEMSFTFGFKKDDRTYDIFITAPFATEQLAHLGKQEALITLMRKYTEALETYLLMYPTQWFNFFPFWSTLPDNEYLTKAKNASY